jgi:hypothetical protein
VLFSREDVANTVSANFEPAWEMVRPVPIITIDFGDGNVVTRTLHGNIATHVCAADGQVVDILPGIYTPAVYLAALQEIRGLAVSFGPIEMHRLRALRTYHSDRAAMLRTNPPHIAYARARIAPPRVAGAPARAAEPDRGKRIMEMRVEQIVVQAPAPRAAAFVGPRKPIFHALAEWAPLAADTWRNETERRLLIHARLADNPATRPEQIKRWLYKEVLHSDLDDPYLGLGDALIGDDVFGDAEA